MSHIWFSKEGKKLVLLSACEDLKEEELRTLTLSSSSGGRRDSETVCMPPTAKALHLTFQAVDVKGNVYFLYAFSPQSGANND